MRRLALFACMAVLLAACGGPGKEEKATAAVAKPALTVEGVMPDKRDWPLSLPAGGNIAAWQEAVIGPELAGQRIVEVKVNVGDVVTRGQVLARIASEIADAEHAESRASVAEAQAAYDEARLNQERARQLRDRGFFSTQQATQAEAAAATARARLDAASARFDSATVRRAKTNVVAADSGVISARSATVGAVVQPGQELFRLIRNGRLEWRAEVAAADLTRLRVGQAARVTLPGGATLDAKLRALSPTVDPRSHTALVYADLPPDAHRAASAGMYARGEFRLGTKPALTVPQSAVLLREGFAYVFRLSGDKVVQVKVTTGRRVDDRIEIEGLPEDARIVAGGVGFLADGDTVRLAPRQEAKTRP